MFPETEEEARARRSQQIVARFEERQRVGRSQQEKKESRFVGGFVVAVAAVAVVVFVAVLIEDRVVSQNAHPATPEARDAASAAVRRMPPRPPLRPLLSPPPSASPTPSQRPRLQASPSPSPSPPPSPGVPSPSLPPPPPSPSPRSPGAHALTLRTCSILIHGLHISLLDNHRCEDGGPGSLSSVCSLGTDYGDCDPR